MRAHPRRVPAARPAILGNDRRRAGLRVALGASVLGASLFVGPLHTAGAQELAEATGMIHGFIGGFTIIDKDTRTGSPVGRPALTIYLSSFRPGKFGPELSLQTIANGISVDLAVNTSLGVSYQFNRHLSVGAGGSILLGLRRWTIDDLDPHYGGYLSATWYPVPMGSWMAFGGQVRESILYDPVTNRVVYYPSLGVGLIFVPQDALHSRRRVD